MDSTITAGYDDSERQVWVGPVRNSSDSHYMTMHIGDAQGVINALLGLFGESDTEDWPEIPAALAPLLAALLAKARKPRMDEEPKLLNCPFCGSKTGRVHPFAVDLWWVICGGCGSRATECNTKETAIAAWNTRKA